MSDREILDFIQNGTVEEEMEKRQDNYEILYTFSKERENILNWYPFCEDADILEVDGECGAITGMLCDRAAHVVSCEVTEAAKKVNCLRNQNKNNLDVVVGKFGDMIFGQTFDYIVINDVFSKAKQYMEADDAYSALLKRTLGLLKPEGKLLIATENRLGLRYFSGAPEKNSGVMFLGLNAYDCYEQSKSFSKKEWDSLLGAGGNLEWRYYYPYPDHVFPNEIFTDETINVMGYGRDCYNFEEKRYLLYNESAVAKSLAKEQIADRFANSFLLEVSLKSMEANERVIYAKIDSDRDERFQIATKIVRHANERYVYKYAVCSAAEEHLKNMHRQELNDSNRKIKSLVSEETPEGLKYEFLTGKTLDSELKELIFNGRKEEIRKRLDQVFEIYFADSRLVDYECEEFENVFGKDKIKGKLECVKPANIDLICDNIFAVEGGYAVIDCEWIFDIYIPKQFIIWRNLNELFYKYKLLYKVFGKNELYHYYEISDTMNSVFESWNRNFTLEYVGANKMGKYSRPKLQMSLDEIAISSGLDRQLNSSLYIDEGAGYSEETKIYLETPINDNHFECSYYLENVGEIESLRWDPTEKQMCICKAFIEIGGQKYRLIAANSDGIYNGQDIFINGDPQYKFEMRSNRSFEVKIYGTLHYLTQYEVKSYVFQHFDKYRKKEEYIRVLEDSSKKLADEYQSLSNENDRIIREKEELQTLIKMMQESKGWKLLDKLRRIRQKIRRL